MEELVDVFKDINDVFDHSKSFKYLSENEKNMRYIIKFGLDNRLALNTFSASNNYWIAITSDKLPANIIQAQRDFFGAHTYQRIDAENSEYFHTNWESK